FNNSRKSFKKSRRNRSSSRQLICNNNNQVKDFIRRKEYTLNKYNQILIESNTLSIYDALLTNNNTNFKLKIPNDPLALIMTKLNEFNSIKEYLTRLDQK
ncbi:9539_t:CDS:1, partial [Funneliformis mosseae]